MHRRSKPHPWRGLLVLALLLPGCHGTGSVSDIRVPPEQQGVLEAREGPGGSIELPGERGFNIHIKNSRQNPGTDGSADSNSAATAGGEASCQAEAANGGSSAADFTIGHRVTNRTGSPQSVRIQLEYALSHSTEASPEPGVGTLGTAHMDLLVLDSHKRNIAKMTVVHATSDEANATVSSQDRRTLTARFEPDRWYDVMLVGHVEASAEVGQRALARLEVKDLKMRFTFSPAATRPAGRGGGE